MTGFLATGFFSAGDLTTFLTGAGAGAFFGAGAGAGARFLPLSSSMTIPSLSSASLLSISTTSTFFFLGAALAFAGALTFGAAEVDATGWLARVALLAGGSTGSGLLAALRLGGCERATQGARQRRPARSVVAEWVARGWGTHHKVGLAAEREAAAQSKEHRK